MEIKFNHVDFIYSKVNYQKKEVLNDINVSFQEGKITGIVGKNGSGKTTMAELIDGLLLPSNGNIQVGNFLLEKNSKNKDIHDLRFQVGLVFQFPEDQIFNDTVKEELAMGLKFYHYKLDQIEKRTLDALKMVGLDASYLDKNPINLSNGEKRKVAIASILMMNPEVLILDEPTIGLDPESKKNFIKLLRILKNRFHKTILIVSHDTDFLLPIVDRVVVLYDKKIVLEGTKYDVFKQVKKLKQYGVKVPQVIEFSDKVLQKKKIKIGYRDEINDLIKDIYRYVK